MHLIMLNITWFQQKSQVLMIFVLLYLRTTYRQIAIYFENVEFMVLSIDLINVCKVAHTDRYEPLLKLIFKVLTENPKSNLPNQCPVKKVDVYFRCFDIVEEKFLFFIRENILISC